MRTYISFKDKKGRTLSEKCGLRDTEQTKYPFL